jgi:hypothetical protein
MRAAIGEDALGCWGWVKAYRDDDDAGFAEHDLELLAQVGPELGSALRRRLDAASDDRGAAPSSPGVVVLDRELRAVSWTAAARDWIAALPLAGLWAAWGILPAVVLPRLRAGNETRRDGHMSRPPGKGVRAGLHSGVRASNRKGRRDPSLLSQLPDAFLA